MWIKWQELPASMSHQPVLMWAWQGPDTEDHHQQASRHAHATFAQQSRGAFGSQAGGQQNGPGAQPEGQHQQCTVERVALAGGPEQGAVHQPAGQPAHRAPSNKARGTLDTGNRRLAKGCK